MSRRIIVAIVASLAISCSVPTEDSAQVIDQSELPESLRNATTTTTTTIARVTEPFTYYLLQQRAEQESRFVVATERPVQIGLSTTEQLRPMFSDDFATPESEAELINEASGFELVAVDSNASGVATVQLEIESLAEVDSVTLADLAAQLVWTLSELDTIDSILIEINGELQPIFLIETGDTSESVSKEDFPRYDREFEFPEAPEEPTTTTTAGDA